MNFPESAALATVLVAATVTGQASAAKNGLGARPYLGWSSWSLEATKYPGYNGQAWLTAQNIKQQSDVMFARLQKHGYTYINIDAGWRGGWDEFGRPAPNADKFPRGMRDLSDYVHAKGQKFGIYYVPGIDDDLLALNPPIKATRFRIRDIVFSPRRLATGWGGGHAIDFSKPGSHEYIQSIADLFASWKIDFLKFDGVTPGSDHYDLKIDARADVEAWGKALIKTGRPIWLTLSWKLDMRFNNFWKTYANAVRITQDVESYDGKLTHWRPQIERHFEGARSFAWAAGRGKGWNDLDSLIVGNGEMSGLTPDERRSTMTLWAIACSPLYIGDDLTKLDAMGLELLTNDDVIAVQQNGNVATLLQEAGNLQTWVAKNEDGSATVAFFNRADTPQHLSASWKDLGFKGPLRVRDVWARAELGMAQDRFESALAPHACR
ncbi:MAG: alpha-galactosidase, partial [Abditibacteriota bacterium]|nr:alpha-galactosidase [Abditibacteriota bacterium]